MWWQQVVLYCGFSTNEARTKQTVFMPPMFFTALPAALVVLRDRAAVNGRSLDYRAGAENRPAQARLGKHRTAAGKGCMHSNTATKCCLRTILLGSTVPHVVQLGTPHLAAAQHLHLHNVWRVAAGQGKGGSGKFLMHRASNSTDGRQRCSSMGSTTFMEGSIAPLAVDVRTQQCTSHRAAAAALAPSSSPIPPLCRTHRGKVRSTPPEAPKRLRSVKVVRTERLRFAMHSPLNTVTRRLFSGTDSRSSIISPGPKSGRCSSPASAAWRSSSSVCRGLDSSMTHATVGLDRVRHR